MTVVPASMLGAIEGMTKLNYFPEGEKVVVHKHEGHVQARIVYYLMNIHVTPRSIYLSRVSRVLHLLLQSE